MVAETKGFCKYCGKEYTKRGMLRHLQTCKERNKELTEEKGEKRCRYFQVVITGKYSKEYWLIIEISENATLKELDRFIRDIWVECCGHLSAFTIQREQYESSPNRDGFWGRPSRSMKYRIKDVADVGTSISYEYDFGSTTELMLKLQSCRDGEEKKNKIVILSRNNPLKFLCSSCRENEARWVDPQGRYAGMPFWCDECLGKDWDGDEEGADYVPEYLLPICNSPRMGECGYEGSEMYPNQFEPDKE